MGAAEVHGEEDRQGRCSIWDSRHCHTGQACSIPFVSDSAQGTNYKEGLTPVLSLLTESSRHHREIRKYIKAQVG